MAGWGGPWSSVLRRIQIPGDAGPNDPRIVITSEPPASIGYPIDAAILFYWNETDYFYMGVSNFGDPATGYLVRGYHSETNGTEDHFEEYSYDNTDGELSSERFIGSPNFASVLELMGYGEFYLSAPTIDLAPHDEYLLDGEDLPRETKAVEDDETATGGITGAETVVHTLTNDSGTPMLANRRYTVRYMGRVSSTVASDRVGIRIRETNSAGTIVRECGEITLGALGIAVPVDIGCLYNGRQVANETVVLTIRRTAGTGTLTYTRDSAWCKDLVTDAMT